jgi:MFS transporter, FHS family, glucose/mannose:H+ symporter
MADSSKTPILEDVSESTSAKPQWLTPTAVAHAGFVPTGIVTVLLGPVLPFLSARWSLTDAQAGALFTAQFLASTIGVAVSGALVPRLGYKAVIVLGLIFMAAGVGAVPMGSRLLGTAAVAGYGIGLGLIIPACNLLVAEVNPHKRASAVSLLNFSWSLGAVACPFLLAPFQRRGILPDFFYALAVFILLISVVLARASFPPPTWRNATSGQSQSSVLEMLRSPIAIALSVLFFVYVGTENAMGGWIASYAKRLSPNQGTLWVTVPSFFYTGLLAGRALAPLILRSMTEVRLARASMALALAGMLALLASRSMPGVMVSATVTGLGLAAMYPITISILSANFGSGATRLGSIMFMLASFGAACMPWMVGAISTQTASLKVGLSVPLLGSVLIFGLYWRGWDKSPVAGS